MWTLGLGSVLLHPAGLFKSAQPMHLLHLLYFYSSISHTSVFEPLSGFLFRFLSRLSISSVFSLHAWCRDYIIGTE